MQIGIFSVASYPYSFKLLWSPFVDSVFSPAFGRRKSWIVPLQLISALLMFACAGWAESRLQAVDVRAITGLFFLLVLCAATQDIAVDGWALTLLARRHVGYAATCQVRLMPPHICVSAMVCSILFCPTVQSGHAAGAAARRPCGDLPGARGARPRCGALLACLLCT